MCLSYKIQENYFIKFYISNVNNQVSSKFIRVIKFNSAVKDAIVKMET